MSSSELQAEAAARRASRALGGAACNVGGDAECGGGGETAAAGAAGAMTPRGYANRTVVNRWRKWRFLLANPAVVAYRIVEEVGDRDGDKGKDGKEEKATGWSHYFLGHKGKDDKTGQLLPVAQSEGKPSDVVCFRSAAADDVGEHEALMTADDIGCFPPNTLYRLVEEKEPGAWEAPGGVRPQVKLLVVKATYLSSPGASRGAERGDPQARV